MTSDLVRALFLDRDGVINKDSGYTFRKEEFVFIDGIFDLCRVARQHDYLIVVVTNQAGIGRGYYTESDFAVLTEWMCSEFKAVDVEITDVLYCPDHPEFGVGHYRRESANRKPNPGMFYAAAAKHRISLAQSIMIGDKHSDMQAAERAGVGVRCHFLLDNNPENQASPLATHTLSKLEEAARLIGVTPERALFK